MGKVIVKFKKVSDTKSVVTYMNGTMALMENYREISHVYDYIGDFKYNDDLKASVALVKKSVGSKVKDTLISYINLDGNLFSYVYSTYFDKYYKDLDMDEIVKKISADLEYDCRIKNLKEEDAIKKVLVLERITKKK